MIGHDGAASMSPGMRLLDAAAALALVAACVGGCSPAPPARPQLLVVIDTNAPVTGMLAGDPDLSADAAIDTLRIDVLDRDNRTVGSETFVAPDPRDWPISFGIVSDAAVRLRLVAYRALFSQRLEGETVPHREVAIDRAVELPAPDAFSEVSIVLDAACRGVAPSFAGELTTCVDAQNLAVPATSGVLAATDVAETRVGTWAEARAVPCLGQGPTGSRCIPGGFAVMGDTLLLDTSQEPQPLLPLRPVILSPFWMDEREFTVGRYRAIANQLHEQRATAPVADPTSLDHHCQYAGPSVSSHDDYPVNCLSVVSAAEACEVVGGRLPSEAQWEFAARGRGERRAYPWGEGIDCCAASVERGWGTPLETHACPGETLEPGGSHAAAASCDGRGDESRDGILDLAGSLIEHTRDRFVAYDHPCWQTEALLRDPTCPEATTTSAAARGASWLDNFQEARGAMRQEIGVAATTVGFRCVYEDQP